MSEALKDILIYHKYQVDTVDNGEDALAYAQVGEYDGIILDIMMPKMDGLQVLSVLRGRGSRTPVLLLTARGEVEERIRGGGWNIRRRFSDAGKFLWIPEAVSS